jgi:hypothetical protein
MLGIIVTKIVRALRCEAGATVLHKRLDLYESPKEDHIA